MTPVEFIERLHADNKAFYSDDRGRGALKDLQVVFPLPWVYLAELVQNAIDAKATRIRFIPGPDGSLLFEHNGKPFTPEDVRALCTRGVSTKSTNTIGFMGVGFKSVFKAYETVVISSGEWTFRLCVPSDEIFQVRQWLGAVLPIWASDAERPTEGYTCRFNLRTRIMESTCEDDLAQLLREGEALLPLLAWNHVSAVEMGERAWALTASEVSINGGDASRVKATASHEEGERSWLLFVKSYQPSELAVLRFLRHRQIQPAPGERDSVLDKARCLREVTLFCELSPDGAPIPVKRGQCFSLVPTGQTTCLGLHMQAEWLLDISRREPMRIAGDPWQLEILAQVPYLLKAYLEWLVSDENVSESWADGYAALPGLGEDTEFDVALRTGAIGAELHDLLTDCQFIPYEIAEHKVNFAAPSEARLLPDPLQAAVASPEGPPAALFGSKVVDPGTLGPRATAFLREIDLLKRLKANELQSEWSTGKVGDWYRSDEQGPGAAYVTLDRRSGRDRLGSRWTAVPLRCLPAADGEWRTRAELKRYPPNWGILNPSPALAATLQPFVGNPAQLLDWKTDQTLRQDASAQKYLKPLEPPSLEGVVAAWWATLPAQPAAADRELVIAFTDLVRRQKTLPRLVPKVLATHNGSDELLPIQQALLADPYVGSYRRELFPKQPTLSGSYLSAVVDATDADWRAFFESQTPSPKGRPTVWFVHSKATDAERASVGELPSLRVTYVKADWRGLTVDSNGYYTADTKWSDEVFRILEQPTELSAAALQRWMVEQPGFFKSWLRPSIVFIPYGSGSVNSKTLERDAQWLAALKQRAWLFDQTGKGPYRAEEILGSVDPSRPDAPVARLVDGFGALVTESGIELGAAIPNAPAIDKLKSSRAGRVMGCLE